MNQDKNSILQILEIYKIAVYEKDVDKFLFIYDPSVRVFDTWAVWIFNGLESRSLVIKNWFGSLGQERVKVDFDDVVVSSSAEISVMTAIGSYTAISPEGVALRSMQNRFTWALKLIAGQWKIIHEHTSVPISNDLTAKLLRD